MAREHPTPPAIRACLFDMDGLLIDSEDKYTVATNRVLNKYGRPNLPWSIKAQLQGRPGPQAGKILHDWAQLPVSHEEYMSEVQRYHKELFLTCQPLPGVPTLLQTLASAKQPQIYIALATSSHKGNFLIKTQQLQDLFAVFPEENRVLGDDTRIPPGRGKPAPDIYLLALETVNERLRREGTPDAQLITPAECLVFEDSVPGVEAGRRAGMQVVWCPHSELLKEYRGREEEVLAGMTGEHKEADEKNEEIGFEAADGSGRRKGAPGEIGDGWARLLTTLEDFPYAAYKMGISSQ